MSNLKLSSYDLETLEKWGWKKSGDNFVGEYQTDHGNCAGLIESKDGQWKFYLLDCPRQVLIGKHGGCLRVRPKFEGRTQHWVHFHTGNPDPVAGIHAITTIIQEALTESPANDTHT